MDQSTQETRTQPTCSTDPDEGQDYQRLNRLEQTIASLEEQLKLCAGLEADLNRDLSKESTNARDLREQLDDLQTSTAAERAKLTKDYDMKLQARTDDIQHAKDDCDHRLRLAKVESDRQIVIQRVEFEEKDRIHSERGIRDSAEIKRLSEHIGSLEAELDRNRRSAPAGGEDGPQMIDRELEDLKVLAATQSENIALSEEQKNQLRREIGTLSSITDRDRVKIRELEESVRDANHKQMNANRVNTETEKKLVDVQAQLDSSKESCSRAERLRQDAEKRCGEAEGKRMEAEQREKDALRDVVAAQEKSDAAEHHRTAAEEKAAEATRVEVRTDKRDSAEVQGLIQKPALSLGEARLPESEHNQLIGPPRDLRLTEVVSENDSVVVHECFFSSNKALQNARYLIETSKNDQWHYCTSDAKKLTSSMYQTEHTLAGAWMHDDKHLVRWRAEDKDLFEAWRRLSNPLKRKHMMVLGSGDMASQFKGKRHQKRPQGRHGYESPPAC